MLGIAEKWRPSWFFGVVGCEYTHTYLWICKDLAWTQGWRFAALFFGSLAILWWLVIAFHAVRLRHWDELFCAFALFLWLFANYWWMAAEAHDHVYPDSTPLEGKHSEQAADVLLFALVWLSVYYVFLMPCSLMPRVQAESALEYDDGSLKTRFAFYFHTFRQYENLHTLFWVAKDFAWNRMDIIPWFVFLVPTILVAADMLYLSYNSHNSTVDTVHYASLLLWVLGNSVWALGEFFDSEYDEAFDFWRGSEESYKTARWYASWILLLALLLPLLLHSMWLGLTLSGSIQEDANFSVKYRRLEDSTI